MTDAQQLVVVNEQIAVLRAEANEAKKVLTLNKRKEARQITTTRKTDKQGNIRPYLFQYNGTILGQIYSYSNDRFYTIRKVGSDKRQMPHDSENAAQNHLIMTHLNQPHG